MQFVLKKTLVLLFTLLLVSLFAFLAFELIPGDPTTMLLGSEYTPERAAALAEKSRMKLMIPLGMKRRTTTTKRP